MPQYISKLILNGVTQMDVTQNTVAANNLLSGEIATGADGAPVVGAYVPTASALIVTVSWDDMEGEWTPDTSLANIRTAYQGGRDIVVQSDTPGGDVVASGNYDDDYDWFVYTVRASMGGPIYEWNYRLTSGGIIEVSNREAIVPNFDSPTASYNPTESVQTNTITFDPDEYNGIQEVGVTVNAIPSGYVGSGITRRSSSDLTASGATVTAPAGYYSSAATKSVANGSATPAASISGTSATVSTGTNTLTLSKTVSNTPQVTAGYVSAGTAGNSSVSLTASVTTKAAATITPGTSNQTIASGTYLTGTQTVSGDANLVSGNIKSGTTIFGVTGTYSGGGSSKNVQAYTGYASRTANSYGATNVTLTVAKAGTYKVSWCAWRSSSSGTMGTNLHKNSTTGTNQQTFTGTYGQCITLTNQSYAAGDVLTLYATSGSNSRTIYVGNLIIEEV